MTWCRAGLDGKPGKVFTFLIVPAGSHREPNPPSVARDGAAQSTAPAFFQTLPAMIQARKASTEMNETKNIFRVRFVRNTMGGDDTRTASDMDQLADNEVTDAKLVVASDMRSALDAVERDVGPYFVRFVVVDGGQPVDLFGE